MDRPLQRGSCQGRDRSQTAGDEALHVGSSAAVEAPAAFGERERIAVPVLTIDRHHVGVTGKHDTPNPVGTKAGEDIRLAPFVVVAQADACAMRFEIGDGPVHQRQVGQP